MNYYHAIFRYCFSPKKYLISQLRWYNKRTCNIGKRSAMLDRMISHNEKKQWYLSETVKNASKENRLFDKVSRPNRRANVLNALFIRNITDVISTGDIAPEILGYSVEITKVKITQDYQVVNVFWQIPESQFENAEEIEHILSNRCYQIRAELISRNVLGKVPCIFFVRDLANTRASEFEKALKLADLGPEEERNMIPDEESLKRKKLYQFKERKDKFKEIGDEPKDEATKAEMPKEDLTGLENPEGMRPNIVGLNRDLLMNRVLITKKKAKPKPEIERSSSSNSENDLFTRIPGMPLRTIQNSKHMFKQFCLERRKEMQQKLKATEIREEENITPYAEEEFDNFDVFEKDFIEEEEDYREFDRERTQ